MRAPDDERPQPSASVSSAGHEPHAARGRPRGMLAAMLLRLGSRLLGSVALVGLIAALGPACGGETACTQIGCESEAIVTFPPNLVMGPYDLVLEGETETATARCLDPSAPETADNPPGLTCDAQGFSLVGHPLANEREVVVTIVVLETGETTSEAVRLEAVEEVTPNGPDCPPLCVIRNGQVRLDSSS